MNKEKEDQLIHEAACFMKDNRLTAERDLYKLISKYIDIEEIKSILTANESSEEPVIITDTYKGKTVTIKFHCENYIEINLLYNPDIKEMKILTFPHLAHDSSITKNVEKIELCYNCIFDVCNNEINMFYNRAGDFILHKSSGEKYLYQQRLLILPFPYYDFLEEWLENYSKNNETHELLRHRVNI